MVAEFLIPEDLEKAAAACRTSARILIAEKCTEESSDLFRIASVLDYTSGWIRGIEKARIANRKMLTGR